MTSQCIFCKIIAREVPSMIVFENEQVYAFLDIHPSTKGHTLLVPKTHRDTFTDVSDPEAAALGTALRALAPRITGALSAVGYNLILNNGSEAGQVVAHAHWHIIPRYADDGLRPWPSTTVSMDELQAVHAVLKSNL